MGAPYAQDLRERILAAYDRGMTTKPIAELFCVSPACAFRAPDADRTPAGFRQPGPPETGHCGCRGDDGEDARSCARYNDVWRGV